MDGVSRDVLRGPQLERRAHGLHRPSGTEVDQVDGRVDDAAALLLPGTALGGWAALRLQGNRYFDGRAPAGLRPALVHCLPGTQLRRRDVVEPFRGLVHPGETTWAGDVRVATLARAAFDEARLARDVREATVVLDTATSTTSGQARTTLAAVAGVVGAHVKVRGIVQARRALVLASSRAASPWETRTRLVAVLDADLRNLSVNVPVFDPWGRLIGVADLLDEATGLVIESDGAHHRDTLSHASDNVREEDFERHGCVVVRATGHDHRDRLALAARMVAAQRDAALVTRRRWTTVAPPWWSTWPGAARYR